MFSCLTGFFPRQMNHNTHDLRFARQLLILWDMPSCSLVYRYQNIAKCEFNTV
jgi:hypothetical protein